MSSFSDSTAYIVDFNRTNFITCIFAFFLPSLVFGIVSAWVLDQAYFKMDLITAFIARLRFDWVGDAKKFEKYAPWVYLGVLSAMITTVVMYVVFTIMLMVWVNLMVGITALLVGIVVIIMAFMYERSKGIGFRISRDCI